MYDPGSYSVKAPKEFGISLTTLLYLKHKSVTIWKKGEERKTAAFEKKQRPPGNQVRSLSHCRLVLENKNQA